MMNFLSSLLFILNILSVSQSTDLVSDFDDVVKENSGEMFHSSISTKPLTNLTANPDIDVTIEKLSKSLVETFIIKLEIQDKITNLVETALHSRPEPKIFTAIERRRILDQVSRTFSSEILHETQKSCEPALHRLVYGLAQITAELSIIAALKDSTYSKLLYKLETADFPVRRKRSILSTDNNVEDTLPSGNNNQVDDIVPSSETTQKPEVFEVSLNGTSNTVNAGRDFLQDSWSPLLPAVPVIKEQVNVTKPFLNKTSLEVEGKIDYRGFNFNATSVINTTAIGELHPHYMRITKKDLTETEKKLKEMELLESKAKKSILFSGEIAFLTAASVISMRRALTQSKEVELAVDYSRSGVKGMRNSKILMANLAKTAARQVAKDAKRASSKASSCDRAKKLTLRYAHESFGSDLDKIANRLTAETVPLVTLAKSMAFVSSQLALDTMHLIVNDLEEQQN